MPVPPPKKDESQSDFMHRCVPEEIGTGPDKRPQDQAVAICLSMWRRAKGIKEPKKDFVEVLERVSAFLTKAGEK